MDTDTLARSADIPVCEFTGHSCPVILKPSATLCPDGLATGKSPIPAGWKACATSVI